MTTHQKLLVENDWYEPVPPNGVMDTMYETLLLARANVLFTGFVPVPLRRRESNEHGHSSPHLALIDLAYRSWWLVLLETGVAPTIEYVNNQAEVLRTARYGRDFARLLAERSGAVNIEAIEHLVTREMPGFFMLLGHPPAPPNTNPVICIGIAEVFRSAGGSHVLRVNGQHPSLPEDRVGTCTRDRNVKILKLTLDPRNSIQLPPHFEIEIEGAISKWTVRPGSGSRLFLVPEGSVTLPVDPDILALVGGTNGRFRLIPYTS